MKTVLIYVNTRPRSETPNTLFANEEAAEKWFR